MNVWSPQRIPFVSRQMFRCFDIVIAENQEKGPNIPLTIDMACQGGACLVSFRLHYTITLTFTLC